MSLIADTSGILVLLDADHALHASARALLEQESVIVPSSVICEVDYMATTRLGAATAQTFLEDLISGAYDFAQIELTDIKRALELRQQYRDANLGFVDTSVMALAERLRVPRILTLDRRHFTFLKPKGMTHLELLP